MREIVRYEVWIPEPRSKPKRACMKRHGQAMPRRVNGRLRRMRR